jgi:hypothetical protein
LAVNAEGLSPDAWLRVELVDVREQALPGYAGEKAAVVDQSGVNTHVRWPSGATVAYPGGPFRIRVNFEGPQRDRARLYALYLDAPGE